jgi:hypothetical protein
MADNDKTKPLTIAIPPTRTIGVLCCFRASGWSVKPKRRPRRLTRGTNPMVNPAATRKLTVATTIGLAGKFTEASEMKRLSGSNELPES